MLSPEIVKLIDQEDLNILFNGKHAHKYVKNVDFFEKASTQDPFKSRYIIYMLEELPPKKNHGRDLVCLFPNHPNPKRRVLDSRSYFSLSSFNTDINNNLKESLDNTKIASEIKMAVVYGNNVFVCKLITGTVYIIWASYINRINAGNVAHTPYRQVPLIFNLDGQYHVKNIFILKSKITNNEQDLAKLPITNGNPLIMQTKPVFVCETQPLDVTKNKLITITKQDALQLSTYQTKETMTWLPYEENIFSKHKHKDFTIDCDESWDTDPLDMLNNNNNNNTNFPVIKGQLIMTSDSIEHSVSFSCDNEIYEERDPFDESDRIDISTTLDKLNQTKDVIENSIPDVLIL